MKRKLFGLLAISVMSALVFATSASAVTMYAADGRTAEVAAVDVPGWRNVGWYDYPVTTVYAADGRTAVIAQDAVSAWSKVGWYTYPVTTVYAPDGRVAVIAQDAVSAWLEVGWYKTPSIVMYAPDGRTANVAFADIEAWRNVGWFESYNEAKASRIVGWWNYNETDEMMEHHSISVYFGPEGSFYADTWRSQYQGTYMIDGNNITVNYDLYFCGAGETTFSYYNSGVWNFSLNGNTLTDNEHYYVR